MGALEERFKNKRTKWLEAMEKGGHFPKVNDENELNIWVMNHGVHNGPGCSICGVSWCWNCTDPDEIPPCEGAPLF